MALVTPFVCALLLIICSTCEGMVQFDCRVDGCLAADGLSAIGTCDPTAPATCTCNDPTTQFNYNCLATAAAVGDITTCGVGCDATGSFSCEDPIATGACICNGEYYSDATTTDCSLKRLRATCAGTASFYYAPHSDFAGIAYFLKADDDTPHPDCLMTEDGTTNIFEKTGYEVTTAPTDTNCPQAIQTQVGNGMDGDTTNDDDIYQWKLRIQHYANIESAADLIVTFECAIPADGSTVEATVSVLSATTPEGVAQGPIAADLDTGITMDIEQSGSTIAGSQIVVTVGSTLDIVFCLIVGAYEDFSVFVLTMYNYEPTADVTGATDHTSVVLVTDACVPKDLGHLVTGVRKFDDGATPTKVTIKITVSAFAFKQATGVNPAPAAGQVWVVAEICVGTCTRTGTTPCDPTTSLVNTDMHDMVQVTGPTTGNTNKRRRRSIEEGSNINLNLSFVVENPRLQSGVVPHHLSTGSSDCYQSAAFLLPLILMGVVLVLSVISTLYFFSKVTRSKRGLEEGHTNMAYK